MPSQYRIEGKNAVSLSLKKMADNATLTLKAIASYELMQQQAKITTRKLLNKTSRKGAGELSQNWTGVIFKPAAGGRVTFGVVNPLPYANIHNTGKPVIRPKSGRKFLAIPLTDKAKEFGYARDWKGPELRFGISSKKNALLFIPEIPEPKTTVRKKRKGRKRKKLIKMVRNLVGRPKSARTPGVYGTPQYLLKKKVKLPATKYMKIALERSLVMIEEERIWNQWRLVD